MRKLFIILSIFSLSACDHWDEDRDATAQAMGEDAEQVANNIEHRGVSVADNVRDHAKLTAEQLRDWWITPLPAKKLSHAVAPSYCYKSLQDILCYRQPMPGMEGRLVAYQGTGAAPPPPVVTEMLPNHKVNPKVLPENRVAAAKPVFATAPEPPPEEPKTGDVPTTLDPAHEQLPNPLNSPQL